MAIGRPIEQTPNIADKVVTATATAGQTQFTVTGGYRINHLAVFRNGVRLVNGNDYTALDGVTITLMEDASNLDVLEFQVFDSFSVSDALLTNAASQTVNGDVTVNGTFTVGSGGIGTFTAAEVVVGIVSSTTGITTVQSLQASSSTTTGALVVKGGVGIGKSLYVGGNLSVGGTVTYEDVTNIDSVGIITTQSGVNIVGGGLTCVGVATFFNNIRAEDGVHIVGGGLTCLGIGTFFNRVLVGTTTEGYADADDLTVANSSHTGITIRSGTTSLGTIAFSDAITGNAEYDGYVQYDQDGRSLRFGTAQSERLRITSAGNIGIGNTASFPIYTDSGDRSLILGTGSDDAAIQLHSGTDKFGGLYFGDATSGGDRYNGYVEYKHDDNYLRFATGGAERLRINSSGQVLIGTTTAQGNANADDLVVATASAAGMTIRSGTSSNGSLFFADGTSGADEYRGWVQYNHTNNYLTFGTNAQERLRITSTGHMGLGVVPSAWPTNADSIGLQIGTGFAAFGRGSGDEDRGGIAVNYYTDGSANYYIGNGNANRIYMNDGNIDFQYASTNSSNAGAALTFVEALRIDTSGRLLLGTTTNRTVWGGQTAFQIEGLTGATSSQTIVRNSNDEWYPWLGFGKSRGTSDGASTIIQDDDCLGVISWNAGDGNDMTSQGAALYCCIDGTPGADDTPGRLEFHTCPDGSSTATERMRLDQGGNLILGGNTAQASDAVTLRQDGEVTASGFYFANNIGSPMNSEGIRRPTTNTIAFDTNTVERVRIGASGQVLIGHTAVIGHNGVDGYLQVTGTGTDSSSVNLNRFSADNWCPFLSFGKSRNATKGSHTIVQNNDYLAYINFAASDGVDFNNTAAFIAVKVDGTPGTDDTPGRIEFATCPDGTNAATTRTTIDNAGATLFSGLTGNTDTRNIQGIAVKSPAGLSFNAYGGNGSRNWRIRPDDLGGWADLDFSCAPTDTATDWPDASGDLVLSLQGDTKDVVVSNGNLKMGVAGKGIDFSVQTATSATGGSMDNELLDHYEEGTWTPVLTSGTGTNTVTYANQVGYYCRVGQLVHVDFYLNFSNGSFGGSGTRLNGLPFSALNWGAGSVFLNNWNVNDDAMNIVCHTSSNSTLYFYVTRDNSSWAELSISTAASGMIGACTYRTGAA